MNDINDFYVRCFKSYVRQKQFISILQFLLLLIYFGLVIAAPTYLIINGVSRFGLKSLFALIFPALWAALFIFASLYYIRCWRATAELAKGKTAEKTGYITKIQKNNYSIADTLPLTSSKRPIYSKPAGFHIPPSRCSGNFKPGDKITIIYARSRELNTYDRLHLAAICAFPCPTEPNDNHKKAS